MNETTKLAADVQISVAVAMDAVREAYAALLEVKRDAERHLGVRIVKTGTAPRNRKAA